MPNESKEAKTAEATEGIQKGYAGTGKGQPILEEVRTGQPDEKDEEEN
jgi:hypothetical protein